MGITMKHDDIDTLTFSFDITAHIIDDPDPVDPRENDNVGTMVCWHRRYSLGDKHSFVDPADFRRFLTETPSVIALPLYLFDHSGLTMRTSSGDFQAIDSAGWDWGQVGWIYVTAEKIAEEGLDAERARANLEAEVREYSYFIGGFVYGFWIETPDAHTLDESPDSCYGFIGLEWAKEAATEAAEYYVQKYGDPERDLGAHI